MLTSLGVLEEPLGNTRLHVARLVASLLYTSSSSHAVVAQELCRLNTMDLLLVSRADEPHVPLKRFTFRWQHLLFLFISEFQDLFFKYTWNNFLHLQVELCVAAILRPCAHEMRLQPGLVAQEKAKPPQDAPAEQPAAETPCEPAVTAENTAHSLMVTHVGLSLLPRPPLSLLLVPHSTLIH